MREIRPTLLYPMISCSYLMLMCQSWVTGELQALVIEAKHLGNSMRESGLTHTGHIFYQQMTTGKNCIATGVPAAPCPTTQYQYPPRPGRSISAWKPPLPIQSLYIVKTTTINRYKSRPQITTWPTNPVAYPLSDLRYPPGQQQLGSDYR